MKKFVSILYILLGFTLSFAANMHNQIRSIPKNLMENVFLDPENHLESLVKSLTSNINNTQTKVKIIHDWICDNISYDTELYYHADEKTYEQATQKYDECLKKRKALCSGYANIMTVMCRLAGIEAKGVSGWSKGFAYPGYLTEQTNHAWNIVKIGGKWQQIDVTWDAGYVDYKTFIKRYTTEWLYRTPEEFIYSHFPENEEYQFLRIPITKEEFQLEPYVPGKFFDYGFRFSKIKPQYTNEISQTTTFDFSLIKQGIIVSASLYDKTSGYNKTSTWINRLGNQLKVLVDIPEPKKYKAMIMAFNQNETKLPEFFELDEFENSIMPKTNVLLQQKKITQKEYEYFSNAFYKVIENERYYSHDTQFATARTAATIKILKLLDEGLNEYENVLYFELTPSQAYGGYGKNLQKFPLPYLSFNNAKNTNLLSPLDGELKKGETVHFSVNTKDFSELVLYVDKKIIPLKKNQMGLFELEYTIPSNLDTLVVYGTKPNSKNYEGLWEYKLK